MATNMVLLLLVLLPVVVDLKRPGRGRWGWHHWNSYQSTQAPTTLPPDGKILHSNVTRYGNNLCHTCTTKLTSCNYNVTKMCPRGYADGSYVVINGDDDHYNNYRFKDRRYDGRKKRQAAGNSVASKVKGWWNFVNNWFKKRGETNTTTTTTTATIDNSSSINASTATTQAPNTWWGRGWRHRGQCVFGVHKTCTESTCQVECCDGTPMDDSTKSCQQPLPSDGCRNGGTLSGNRKYCLCPSGYVGTACQHRQCSLKCRNGGVCQTRVSTSHSHGTTSNSDDHCVCPSDTKGKFCEISTCTKQCQNNGTCSKQGNHWVTCVCPPGFHGEFCEKDEKDGECPIADETVQVECTWWKMRRECKEDSQCPGNKKCCQDACGHGQCSEPYNNNGTCHYQNKVYTVGSVFSPDKCRMCTCNVSHVGEPQAVVECTRMTCPDMLQSCTNPVTPPGGCCPLCQDDPDVNFCAGKYTFPNFVNCPDKEVTLNVEPNSNTAVINIDLRAKDCKGSDLQVRLSQDELKAGTGEENFRLVSATTERDGKGNFAECLFHVHIRDTHPPEFIGCPSNFAVPQPGPVTWQEPVARDNVGLSKPATSTFTSGQTMQAGDVMVEYWAQDYQGNLGYCQFVITVGNGSHIHIPAASGQHLNPPAGSHWQQHHTAQPASHTMAVGLAVTCTTLVLLLLSMAVYFYRRQRLQRTHAALTAAARLANGPSQWSSGPGPVPHYSTSNQVHASPPMYSPSDEHLGAIAAGYDQAEELPSKASLA